MIVGLGETGLSYARYLSAAGTGFSVAEDSPNDAAVSELGKIDSTTIVHPINDPRLHNASDLYISPGVPLALPAIVSAINEGAQIHGDIQMFGQLNQSPVVAITGTNGKSTVADLIQKIAADQGVLTSLAGNIGTPCLDVLHDDSKLYVLELSSYQLEIATNFPSSVAVVLNLAADHLDRYPSSTEYFATKLSLYEHAEAAVINRELQSRLPSLSSSRTASFGSDQIAEVGAFGLAKVEDQTVLLNGSEELVSSNDLLISGEHNLLNVLACFAIGWLRDFDMAKMISTAKQYRGLAHRNEVVGAINGVTYINDSKATNPAAMIAAINGQVGSAPVVLIAGGVTKGLSFDGVQQQFSAAPKAVLLIGGEKDLLANAFNSLPVHRCEGLAHAVDLAAEISEAGDVVLLSPGCASFDEFSDFEARGDAFRQRVTEISA